MLTGDNKATAEAVARTLDLDEVVAEVLPDQKAKAVKKFQQGGDIIAMAGDGINDAPALAQAEVGIPLVMRGAEKIPIFPGTAGHDGKKIRTL